LTITACQIKIVFVIQSFRHKGLKRLFEKGEPQGIRADYVEKLENILAVLHRARAPGDMSLPGFRLHPLKGSRKGSWSVTVRANWRVVFRFQDGHACDVDLVDYH
jgi:proteic killer suppression protein